MTGSFAPEAAFGVQMLRNRQSSLTGVTYMNSFVHGSNSLFGPWMHDAPKWSAISVPFQDLKALGTRQRRLPTGGGV